MSLDKAVQHGKEKRKQYTGAKAIDRTCRNHGSCAYCGNSRLYKSKKREPFEIITNPVPTITVPEPTGHWTDFILKFM